MAIGLQHCSKFFLCRSIEFCQVVQTPWDFLLNLEVPEVCETWLIILTSVGNIWKHIEERPIASGSPIACYHS